MLFLFYIVVIYFSIFVGIFILFYFCYSNIFLNKHIFTTKKGETKKIGEILLYFFLFLHVIEFFHQKLLEVIFGLSFRV